MVVHGNPSLRAHHQAIGMIDPRPKHTSWDGSPVRHFKIDVADRRSTTCERDWRERDGRTGEPWAFGVDPAYLRDLCQYWRNDYDWRRHEAAINRFSQFKARIAGIDLHFIHEIGEGTDPKPLLLTHGWPGSFYEYHRRIPRLTHPSRFGGSPDDAFTVVVPSMPGHGYSFSPDQPHFGLTEIADV